MKYLLIVLAVAFAMPSMAEEDAPKRMTSAEKKAALLEKYDINKDGIPELIVGCDRIWDEEDKSYIRKFCQVYECMKTSNGYQTKKQ